METLFSIDICGDCSYYCDCNEKDKKNCEYSLDISELIKRLKEFYKNI